MADFVSKIMKNKKNRVSQNTTRHDNEDKSRYVFPLLMCISAMYVAVLLMIHGTINEVQPVPYLDEIYHVPQAQEYCGGNFSHV